MFTLKNALARIDEGNRIFLWGLLFVLFIIVLTAYTIVNADPYLWAGILFVFLALSISKSNVLGLYMIAISVFFADWLTELNLVPAQFSWVPEIVIVLYIFNGLLVKPRRMNSRFFLLFIPFFVTALLSMVVNFGEEHIITILFGFRTLFRFVILSYSIQVLPFPERDVKRFINFLFFLLVIQIPVAVFKLFIYGQGESAIGTSGSGGLYSTLLPLIGISLFFGLFYFLRRRSWYILLCVGFLAFGIIGGKRGILFLVPVLVIYLFLNIPKLSRLRIRVVSYVALLVLLILSIWAPLTFLNTLKNDPLGYAMNYEFATSGDQTIGRMSTTIGVFQMLSSQSKRFVFGFGPGSFHNTFWPEYTGRVRRDVGSYGFLYGVTGFSWSAIEFGYLGAFLYLVPIAYLYIINRRFFQRTEDAYWKAISFGLSGIIFSSVIINIIYGEFYRLDIPAFFLYFFGGLIYKKEAHERLWTDGKGLAAEQETAPQPDPVSRLLHWGVREHQR